MRNKGDIEISWKQIVYSFCQRVFLFEYICVANITLKTSRFATVTYDKSVVKGALKQHNPNRLMKTICPISSD